MHKEMDLAADASDRDVDSVPDVSYLEHRVLASALSFMGMKYS